MSYYSQNAQKQIRYQSKRAGIHDLLKKTASPKDVYGKSYNRRKIRKKQLYLCDVSRKIAVCGIANSVLKKTVILIELTSPCEENFEYRHFDKIARYEAQCVLERMVGVIIYLQLRWELEVTLLIMFALVFVVLV